jgi:hypothetical protein
LGADELPAVGLPDVHVTVLALTKATLLQGDEPNVTVTVPAKLSEKLPVMAMAVPPSVLPRVGEMLARVGVRDIS